MKISTKWRYGTRLMLVLALKYDQKPVLLREISKSEDISEKYLSQIIIPLKNSGLVNSFRGAKGGYKLSKPPSSITLDSIVKALDGEINVVKCIKDRGKCKRIPKCVTRDLWVSLNEEIARKLKSVKLSDLVDQYKRKEESPISYSI